MNVVSPRRSLAPGGAPALTVSARSVLRTLASSGPITRPSLSALLGFSKPTMSLAVAELTALGLVAEQGVSKGTTGRSAALYGLGSSAGYVVGVDAGTTHVRAVAMALDGQVLARAEKPLAEAFGANEPLATEALRQVAERVTGSTPASVGPPRAAAVAVPHIVADPARDMERDMGRNMGPDTPSGAVLAALRGSLPSAVLVENNVNCAALAELHHGAAAGRAAFAYLQVGVKIGLGIVLGGRVFRGVNGAAGEVGRLPFPWSPRETPRCEALEQYLGSQQLLARVRAAWPGGDGAAPETTEELFSRATHGDPAALAAVERHADDIGRLVAACVGIIDPGLVVLGGGVGQNAIVVERVRRVVRELAWPTDIAVTQLGAWATVEGAARLAREHALAQLLGADAA